MSNYELTVGRFDANDTHHTSRQLENKEAKTYDIKYPDLLARQLIPVDTATDFGANTVSYDMYDHLGEAEIVHDRSSKVPLGATVVKNVPKKVQTVRFGWHFNQSDVDDWNKSKYAGAEFEMANVREKVERKLDRIAAIGDTVWGMEGLANNSNIASTNAAAVWAGAAAQAVYDDMIATYNEAVDAQGGIESFTPTHFLLPTASYLVASSVRNTQTDRTAMQLFQEATGVTVVKWSLLATANGGTSPRGVLYRRSSDVLVQKITKPFHLSPVYQRTGFNFAQDGEARTAGTCIRYEPAIRYLDGI